MGVGRDDPGKGAQQHLGQAGAFVDHPGEGHHQLKGTPIIRAGVMSYAGASLSKICVMSCPFSISAHILLSQARSYFTQGTISSSICTFSDPLP